MVPQENETSEAVNDLSALSEELQLALDAVVENDKLPGATLAIALPDGKQLSLASGFEDPELEKHMPVNGQMMVGSTGKTFVSAVALQLVTEGKIGLEDLASKYFADEDKEWFARLPNADSITVRSLLNHTSGIPRYVFSRDFLSDLRENPRKARSPRECVAVILDMKPIHAVGEGWGYSDTNYLILGMIIEKVTESTFYQEAQSRLLSPLELKKTIPTTQAKLPGLVQGHANQPNPFNVPARTGKGWHLRVESEFRMVRRWVHVERWGFGQLDTGSSYGQDS